MSKHNTKTKEKLNITKINISDGTWGVICKSRNTKYLGTKRIEGTINFYSGFRCQ